jgi:predicted lipid carrier protein YhbT
VDGVGELLEVFVPITFDVETFAGNGETLHLHATDAAGEWLVTFEPEKVVVTEEHAKGDIAARGPALDLLRLMWGRTPGPELTLFGNAAILDRFHVATRF